MATLLDAVARLPPALRVLFEDARITEICINGSQGVFFERGGKMHRFTGGTLGAREAEAAALAIARPLGYGADAAEPIVDVRLADGSRVAIASPPVAPEHCITVRRAKRRLTLEDLLKAGALGAAEAEAATRAIRERRNVLISGATGSGKTTLLQALADGFDERERVVVIEDTRELALQAPNCVRLEARRGEPAVTIRELVRHALRHRPDRIVVGEVRGPEARDLLAALNTGHGGSLTTLHAHSAERAPRRLAAMAQEADGQMPWEALCAQVAEAIDVVVQVERDHASGRRRVVACRELEGYDRGRDAWLWGADRAAARPVLVQAADGTEGRR